MGASKTRSRRRAALAAAAAVGIVAIALLLRGRAAVDRPEAAPERAQAARSEPIPPVVPPPEASRERVEVSVAPETDEGERAPTSPSERTALLRVHVRSPWDEPVTEGTLVVWRSDSTSEPVARKGIRAGGAEVRLPVGVPHRVTALPSHSDASCSGPATVDPVLPESKEVTIRFAAKCGRISGRIVSAETGEALSPAGLTYEEPGGANGAFSGLARGEFGFMLPPGSFTLTATAVGYVPERVELFIVAGDWIRDYEIPLARIPLVLLRGRVSSADGPPIPSARVRLSSYPPPTAARATAGFTRPQEFRTDDSGRFVGRVPVGEQALFVEAEGHEPSGTIPFSVTGEGEEIEVVLYPGGNLRLRCATSEGKSVEPLEVVLEADGVEVIRAAGELIKRRARPALVSGTVRLQEKARWEAYSARPVVEKGGAFVVEGVPPGTYEVTARAGALEGQGLVRVDAGETAEIELVLREGSK